MHGVPLTDEQIRQMKVFILENGPKWNQLGDIITKPANALKLFFLNYKKKYGFDDALLEYYEKHPNEDKRLISSDGAESDMSASSSDERDANSDTASAESPGNQNHKEVCNTSISSSKTLVRPVEDDRLIPPLNQPPKRQKTQEEYDSSATETADEENESSPANRHSPKVIHYPFTGPNGPRSDSNVRDIISNVIEKAIKDQSIGLPPPIAKPTSFTPDGRTDVSFVKEYRNENLRITTANQGKLESLPSISIVNIPEGVAQIQHHKHASLNLTSQISATITPVSQKTSHYMSTKNELEPQTLDLSVKKTVREHFPPPAHINSQTAALTIYRNDTVTPSGSTHNAHLQVVPQQPMSYSAYHHDMGRSSKSPSSYSTGVPPITLSPTPHNICAIKPMQQPISQTPPSKGKITPKLSPKIGQSQQNMSLKGSITHGTPVSSSQTIIVPSSTSSVTRFDNIFRQTPPSGSEKSGSITQGTPVHLTASHMPDKRMYDYYKSNRQSPAQNTSQQGSPQSSFGGLYNRVAFTDHPQLSSKQIIMNDYLTSQQMIGQQSRNSRPDKEPPRSSHSMSSSPATIYYGDKDRNRAEYVNRSSPADRNR